MINILLNINQIKKFTANGSYTWISTFAHEITHAIDYHTLAKIEGLDEYDPLLDKSKFYNFLVWSEYHAQKRGYYFMRAFMNIDNCLTRKRQIEHILITELPYHMNNYYQEYHANDNRENQIYITMQLLGRISVWCDIFPDIFNDKYLKQVLDRDFFMYELLIWLRKHEEIDTSYIELDEMRQILEKNWKSL